jgi:hypothetical protein
MGLADIGDHRHRSALEMNFAVDWLRPPLALTGDFKSTAPLQLTTIQQVVKPYARFCSNGDRCFDRHLWPEFKFFALVRPDNDILPVRSVYNGTTQNIGINYLTSKEPIWFAGPDVIASVLLSGKVPHIEKAMRVVPRGKQSGLGATSLRGMVNVDAGKNSFFKHVIEQRAAHESSPELHYWLKILANSGLLRPVRRTQSYRGRCRPTKSVFRRRVFRNSFRRIWWSPTSGDARKVHRGCRGPVSFL